MSPRARVGLFTGVIVASVVWLAPTIAAWLALGRDNPDLGLRVDAAWIWPVWPFGVQLDDVEVDRAGRKLAVERLRLEWSPLALHVDADLGGGTIMARAEPLGRPGLVQFRNVPVEPLLDAFSKLGSSGIRLSGRASGVARWDREIELSGHLVKGRLAGPMGVRLAIDHVDALTSADASGRVEIQKLAVSGPELELSASGHVDQGIVDLELALERLDDPLRGMLELARMVPERVPTTLRIQGSPRSPRITELGVP